MPKSEPKNAIETLEGKTVLVTGGTTGIGRAIAIALAAEGATIFTFGRHAKELKEGLRAIQKAGDADGMVADAAKREDVEAVFEKIATSFGATALSTVSGAHPIAVPLSMSSFAPGTVARSYSWYSDNIRSMAGPLTATSTPWHVSVASRIRPFGWPTE